MRSKNTAGVILGHKNINEADKLVFLYTENFGKIIAIAKGARKITSKFTGHLETLNFVKVELYFGGKYTLVKEIETIKNFKEIRDDLEKLRNTLKVAEITNKLTYENEQIPNLTQLLENCIKLICSTKRPHVVIQSYTIKILNQIGVIPDFKEINTVLEKKYFKYLNFIKTKPLEESEKIHLSLEEEKNVDKIIKKLLQYA